ncbi:MAG: OsmC family protein [Cellulomonas sp.]
MSTQEASSVPAATGVPTSAVTSPVGEDDAPAELWVERTGRRTYTGRSSRGAEVRMGPVEAGAVFTPGELLKIALAGCAGMSADTALAHRLGDDVPVTVRVWGPSDPEQDRYPELHEELVVDLSSLDESQRERLVAIVHRAVDLHCTVGRTLQHGASTHLSIAGED